MSLHFGLLDLLSRLLQSRGYASTPLMQSPLSATGVAEFWSRWNTGFRDLAREFVFYPLVRRKHVQAGMWLTFIFSGIVHDIVMSIPARGGYGWPTLYFLIQASAVSFERSWVGKWCGLGQSWRGRLFAGVVILGPISLLVHEPFRTQIVLPMLQALGDVR